MSYYLELDPCSPAAEGEPSSLASPQCAPTNDAVNWHLERKSIEQPKGSSAVECSCTTSPECSYSIGDAALDSGLLAWNDDTACSSHKEANKELTTDATSRFWEDFAEKGAVYKFCCQR